MLYMVELDFTLPEREADWEAWYAGHLRTLLDMPGFRSAQRFRSVTPAASPYLAIYGIASLDVFQSEPYRARAGRSAPGEWTQFMTRWHRNVFDGLAHAPGVAIDDVLLVVDRPAPSAARLPHELIALRCVGLDRTVHERGIAACSRDEAERLASRTPVEHTRIMRPLGTMVPASA